MTHLISHRTLVTGTSKNPERMVHSNGPLRSMLAFPLSVQLIETSTGYWLFDTGMSDHMRRLQQGFWSRAYKYVVPYDTPPGASAKEQLAQLGIFPNDVSHIVLSHFHVDHIGALRDFPDATIVALSSGLHELQSIRGLNGARRGLFDVLLPDDVANRFDAIEDRPSTRLTWSGWSETNAWSLSSDDSIVAVELPGHATGQVGLLLDGPEGTFHVADAAWTSKAIQDNVAPSQITRLLHRDWDDYLRTLDRLHSLWETGPAIKPCHCHDAHGNAEQDE